MWVITKQNEVQPDRVSVTPSSVLLQPLDPVQTQQVPYDDATVFLFKLWFWDNAISPLARFPPCPTVDGCVCCQCLQRHMTSLSPTQGKREDFMWAFRPSANGSPGDAELTALPARICPATAASIMRRLVRQLPTLSVSFRNASVIGRTV